MNHLFIGIENRRLYLLTEEDLRNMVVLTGDFRIDNDFTDLMELRSGFLFSLPSGQISQHIVPDNKIYPALNDLGVTGLVPVVPINSAGKGLPISGNISNPSWVSISLSGKCDSKCTFCYTEFIRNAPSVPSSAVIDSLIIGRQSGADEVVFTGGEPTLRNDLFKLIATSRELGYRRVQLQSNGHRLADAGYLAKIIEAGLSGVLLSLHGPTADIHDKITQTQFSFDRATQVLSHLERTNLGVIVNFVVCRANGPFAQQAVEYLKSRCTHAIMRFSFLIVEGGAYSFLRHDMPTIPEFVEWVSPAVNRARELGVIVEVENVPSCVSSLLGVQDRYNLPRRRTLMQVSPFYMKSYRRGEVDVKMSYCEDCTKADGCSGLQAAYLSSVRDGASHIYPSVFQ